jgi:hypothetical protein
MSESPSMRAAREMAERIKRDWYAWGRGEIQEDDLDGERFMRLSVHSSPDSVLTEIIMEHAATELGDVRREAVEIANRIQNENDLNDGGFFEAGFIAAKTKIIDALIEARDTQPKGEEVKHG